MSEFSAPIHGNFCTEVRLKLRTVDGEFSLGQIAPDFIILDPPLSLPPGAGEIVLSIDGRERTWTVELPAGSSTAVSRTAIRRL